MGAELHQIPFIFGEVLFDVFPDGTEILGGAPFNVAWHLQGLGERPLMISRVGKDDRGDRIIEKMDHWGMHIDGMQSDPERPTGEVLVTFDSGQPNFEVRSDCAYDCLECEPIEKLMGTYNPSLLYHGTLALRSDISRVTLQQCFDLYQFRSFIDINLRDPWWEEQNLKSYLDRATWVKLNDEELKQIGLVAEDLGAMLLYSKAEMVIVTQGEEGASILTKKQPMLSKKPSKLDRVEDTVGAGDAFSAVAILGIMEKWPEEVILSRALGFASKVCTIQGAITDDWEFYHSTLDQWSREERSS